MDDKAADTDGIGGVDDAMSCILEQGPAETFAMMGTSYRESPENHYRNRIGHVASKVAWGGGRRDCRGRQRVVANDLGLFADDEGARCATDLIGHGAALQPGVKRFDPAVKTGDDMVEREWLRGAGHLLQVAVQGALVRIVFCNRLFGCAG